MQKEKRTEGNHTGSLLTAYSRDAVIALLTN